VCRCPTVEALLDSGELIGTPDELETALAADVSPIDDIRSTAEYRQRVAARLLFFGPANS
jgi:CO/xanthine dehydrogenase FAD-binding subunit